MMRKMLLLLGVAMAPNVMALDRGALMRAYFSVVLVRGYDAQGALAYGTGVVVGEGRVVTNCHVLRHTPQAWVSQGEQAYPIQSIHADTWRDLCLLKVERLPLKPVTLGSTADLRHGAEVAAISHSNGLPNAITSVGQIKSRYTFDGGRVVRSSARFAMGASGSPLFDAQGRLIGINTFKTPGRQAYYYAVPVEWLAQLERLPASSALPVAGQAFWESADDAKPYFMQSALPHLNRDWARLAEIARSWTTAEPGSAEAWYELGSAHQGLGEHAAAEAAYARAVERDPGHGPALLHLGLYAAGRGEAARADRISAHLAAIDAELQQQLQRTMRCGPACPAGAN